MTKMLRIVNSRTFASTNQKLPPGLLTLAAVLMPLAVMAPNTLLVISAIGSLFLGGILLWRPGESPILLFVFFYQWLQISAAVLYSSSVGMDVNNFSRFNSDMHTATFLSLFGLLFFAGGMRLGAGPTDPAYPRLLRTLAHSHSMRRWFWLYLTAWGASACATSLAWLVPGLSQPLFALADLKWAFFLILTYVSFASPRASLSHWFLAFGIEFLSSFGGFFSDFKTVFFLSFFGVVAARSRLSVQTHLALIALGSLLLLLALVWTSIKPNYRAFVSGGARAQVVTVDYGAQMAELARLVSNVDFDALSAGAEDLVRRIAYVEFFSVVIDRVPEVIPYEGGAIWLDAIIRPFTPRILFPNKSEINDSERTNKYTGLSVSGAESGTSISLGLMSESYIDFGPFGMMAALAVYGYLLGWIYQHLSMSKWTGGLLGMGIATAVLRVAWPFESSITKVFGGIVVIFLVSVILSRFVIPRFAPWVRL